MPEGLRFHPVGDIYFLLAYKEFAFFVVFESVTESLFCKKGDLICDLSKTRYSKGNSQGAQLGE